jgi:lantibiotic biosynthesis protein
VQPRPVRGAGLHGEPHVGGPAPGQDPSAEACWRPIVSSTLADEALQAVDAIAESIPAITPPPDGRNPSLSRGQAGLALLYAWLARSARAPLADVVARQYLDQAIDTVATQAMKPALFGGFAGVAWAAELVDHLLEPDAADRNEEVDDAVLQLLSQPNRWPAPHDLVEGVTGLGVYALQRYPRHGRMECLSRIVERLHESARQDEDGFYWRTPPSEIHEEWRREYPTGRVDLGVAHGAAGAIGILGAICGGGVEQSVARPLLEGAVGWLLAHAIDSEAGPTFPLWVAPSFQPYQARCAWCYGDPGMAATLLVAARGLGDADWEREAVALACRAAERPESETGVVNACFCHGAAGLAHLYNRIYQATGEEKLRQAAVHWVERTLDFYRRARGTGSDWVQGSWDPAQPTQWTWTGVELVEGAAGVALVLLAAATSLEPRWDRMFLVSAPGLVPRASA